MKQGMLKLGVWAILALYLSYYVATTSFYHAHYYAGGMIYHSHFYHVSLSNTANDVQHKHTQAQYNAISDLMNIIIAGIASLTILFYYAGLSKIFIHLNCKTVYASKPTTPARAPPKCF